MKKRLFTLLILLLVSPTLEGVKKSEPRPLGSGPSKESPRLRRAGPELVHASPAEKPLFRIESMNEAKRQWVEKTLAAMTLEEKVGQLLVPGFRAGFFGKDSSQFQQIEPTNFRENCQ